MANLYGVASPNPGPIGLFTIGNTTVTCPAGTETNVVQGTAPLPTLPGWFYPAMFGSLVINNGASLSTGINVAFRLNGGADILGYVLDSGLYIANQSFIVPIAFYAPAQSVLSPTGVWNFQISIAPSTNGVSARAAGTYINAVWIRAPDQ